MTTEAENSRIVSPQLSVVMSVYNGERFLSQALSSILNQTFTDFELIIIDDGSTDRTAQILDNFDDPRCRRLTNHKNIGLTASLNLGLESARGEFIARHDADDTSHPERFQKQLEKMRTFPSLGLLGTAYVLVDEKGMVLDVEILPITNAALQEKLSDGNCLCHGSVMMRRRSLDLAGVYRTAFRVTQDYDLWLRLAEHCELGNLESPLYNLRFDGESVSRNKRALQLAYRKLAFKQAQRRRDGLEEIEFPTDVLAEYPPEPERLLRDSRRSAYLFYLAGQEEKAENMMVKVRQYLPAVDFSTPAWESWLLGRSHAIVSIGYPAPLATRFIEWFGSELDIVFSPMMIRQAIGRFYAELAFSAYKSKPSRSISNYAWQAIRYDREWLRNRGLLTIAGKSLLGVR